MIARWRFRRRVRKWERNQQRQLAVLCAHVVEVEQAISEMSGVSDVVRGPSPVVRGPSPTIPSDPYINIPYPTDKDYTNASD